MTQFLTQFLKKRTKKEGTGRHLPKSEFPYFTGATALYGTGRNFQECRPISNKIPSPRWAVTKVAVHLPFARFPEASTCETSGERVGLAGILTCRDSTLENSYENRFDTVYDPRIANHSKMWYAVTINTQCEVTIWI